MDELLRKMPVCSAVTSECGGLRVQMETLASGGHGEDPRGRVCVLPRVVVHRGSDGGSGGQLGPGGQGGLRGLVRVDIANLTGVFLLTNLALVIISFFML